ncbi:MAG: hypothetical protein ACI4XL_11860 [Bacillus sp. (in: firmicutes)]
MKRFRKKNDESGQIYYLIAESEFIGIKDFVLLSEDRVLKRIVTEEELKKDFVSLGTGDILTKK